MTSPLARWGFDAAVAALLGPGAAFGRVTRVDRGECDVMTDRGSVRAISDSVRAQGEMAPVTGDWVELAHDPALGELVDRVLPRRTELSRRDPAERDVRQVLAANVDVVAIVHGLDRPLPPGRLERMMVVAEDSDAEVVIVLAKADLVPDDDETAAIVAAVVGPTPIIRTSTEEPGGLDDLRALIGRGRTLALLGASGTGKSSLVNGLLGEDLLAVGEVRVRDSKGRHTTTARELVLLPDDGGLVLDTPGIRAVGLWDSEEALHRVFADLDELSRSCRFNDCRHDREPGCALVEGVGTGELDGRRVDRYRALIAELEAQRERERQRERAPERRHRGRRPRRR